MLKALKCAHVSMAALALSIAVGSPVSAIAQVSPLPEDQSQPPTQVADEDGATDSDVIIVTAQRRDESLQKVPIAITAITSEQLVDNNIYKVNDIEIVTSGLTMHNSDGALQPYIRGIGTTANLAGLEPAVASYFDGAYLPQSLGVLSDVYDMESIQVLKGPQGTLWGRNATGGAILYTTADPELREFSAEYTQEFGNRSRLLSQGVVNVPIGDTVAIRVAGQQNQSGAYVDNIITGERLGDFNRTSLRGKIKWEPNDRFSAVLTGDYYDNYDHNNFRTLRSDSPLCGSCALGVGTPAPGFYETTVNDFVSFNGESNSFTNTSTGARLHLSYSGDVIEISSLTSYRDNLSVGSIDVGNAFVPLFDFSTRAAGKTFDQELQASTNMDGWLNGLVGLSYIDDKTTFDGVYTGAAFAPLVSLFGVFPATDNAVKTNSMSVYGELYLTPLDRLKLTLGGRYATDARELLGVNNISSATAFLGNPALAGPFSAKATFSKFTPRLVVAYDLDALNIYASYNRGFKAGGFNTPVFVVPDPVRPEVVDSYEIGAKYVSDDRRLTISSAAYYYDYSDIQVTVNNLVAQPTIQNAAKARGYGGEVDLSYRMLDWLRVYGSLAYVDAKYTSFPNASVSILTPTGIVGGTEDLSGRRLPNTPKFSASFGASVEKELTSRLDGNLNVAARYSVEYDLQPGGGGPSRYAVQPEYVLVNVSGYLEWDRKYRLGFYVTNATNKKYYGDRTLITGDFGGLLDQVAPPRAYGLRVSASF